MQSSPCSAFAQPDVWAAVDAVPGASRPSSQLSSSRAKQVPPSPYAVVWPVGLHFASSAHAEFAEAVHAEISAAVSAGPESFPASWGAVPLSCFIVPLSTGFVVPLSCVVVVVVELELHAKSAPPSETDARDVMIRPVRKRMISSTSFVARSGPEL